MVNSRKLEIQGWNSGELSAKEIKMHLLVNKQQLNLKKRMISSVQLSRSVVSDSATP